jgi:hypothetical protein
MAALAAALAFVLVVLLAGVVGDFIPSTDTGTGTGTPGALPTLTLPPGPAPAPTSSGVPSPAATDDGDGGGDPGADPTTAPDDDDDGDDGGEDPPPRPPTAEPTPTPSPTSTGGPPPVTGPDRCTVTVSSCDTRQVALAPVSSGRLGFVDSRGRVDAGSSLREVPVGLGVLSLGRPAASALPGRVAVADVRGVATGWRMTATVALPTEVLDRLLVTVDPWCRPAGALSAPGVVAGPPAQRLDDDGALVCSKDSQLGPNSSTGGVYEVGVDVTVATWKGAEFPVTTLPLVLTVA